MIPHLFTSFITILFLHLSLSLLSFSHFRFSNLFFSVFPSFHSSLSLLLSSSLSDLSFFHSFIIFLIYSVNLSICSHILSSISFPALFLLFFLLPLIRIFPFLYLRPLFIFTTRRSSRHWRHLFSDACISPFDSFAFPSNFLYFSIPFLLQPFLFSSFFFLSLILFLPLFLNYLLTLRLNRHTSARHAIPPEANCIFNSDVINRMNVFIIRITFETNIGIF